MFLSNQRHNHIDGSSLVKVFLFWWHLEILVSLWPKASAFKQAANIISWVMPHPSTAHGPADRKTDNNEDITSLVEEKNVKSRQWQCKLGGATVQL